VVTPVVLLACGNGSGGDLPKLDKEMVLTIKQDYVRCSYRNDADKVDDVLIHRCYGAYNNSVVLALSGMTSVIIDIFGGTETVAGKTFSYAQPGYQILVWHKDNFYTLTLAYAKKLLTKDNIDTIWNLYQNKI